MSGPRLPHQATRSAGRQAWWRAQWQARGPWAWLLTPMAGLYAALLRARRLAYAGGLLRAATADCPVIVVGNVTVGGAGKTPVVIALVQHLQAQGWRPGVIARGYGRSTRGPRLVQPGSTPDEVGDEPLLLHQRTGAPCAVATRRIDAARLLRAQPAPPDVLVCDDGLQHLGLRRDLEICVFHEEGTGNGWLLPAGPLREPWPRPVDAVLHAGPPPALPPGARSFALQRRLAHEGVTASGQRVALDSLRGQPVHAVAAIARPEAFFAMLRACGLTLASTEARPDHAGYAGWQAPASGLRVVCTEKDAAKLWPHCPDAVAVPLEVAMPPAFWHWLGARCAAWPRGAVAARPI